VKPIIIGLAVATLIAMPSFAQTTSNTTDTSPATGSTTDNAGHTVGMSNSGKAAASGNNNQAVATTNANADQPAKGSNSFTMGQAKSRLENHGFTNVNDLKKDNDGVWRAMASQNGQTEPVWLDYKGNVGVGQ
jgi:hypothetical protein